MDHSFRIYTPEQPVFPSTYSGADSTLSYGYPTSYVQDHQSVSYTIQDTPNRYSSRKVATKAKRKRNNKTRNYQRYPKPPYSYVGMIIIAIETSPDHSATLQELNHTLEGMFDFFRGPYKGWKDSVRHTLSHSSCFVRTDQKREGTFVWVVDLTKAPSNVFNRQDSRIAVQQDSVWAPTLFEQLDIPVISLPRQSIPVSTKSPDFTFSIDNILTDVTSTTPADDSRNVLSPSYDSPVFTTKTIKLKRNKKKTQENTHKELSKMIADQSAAWGISQAEAIDNLSFLCKSVPSPVPVSDHASPPITQQPVYSPITPTTQQTSPYQMYYTPDTFCQQYDQMYNYSPYHGYLYTQPASQPITAQQSPAPLDLSPSSAPTTPLTHTVL